MGKLGDLMIARCDELVAEAATLAGDHDMDELRAWAENLCGLGGLTYEEMRARTAGITVPGDFRHFRLTNLDRDLPWGGYFSESQEPLEFGRLLRVTCIMAELDDVVPTGRGIWTETYILPIRDAGVLELGLRFLPLH